jgi:hypothetical protein
VNKNPPPKVRPAFDTLREIREGGLLDDVAAAINSATREVRETGRKAEITVKLTIAKAGKHPYAVNVRDVIAVKLPERDRPESIMFITDDDNLQVQDPKQRTLDLKAVEDPETKKELREVTA